MRIDNAVGERIRKLRKERGLTLKDIALRSGYGYQTVASYENGSRRVGIEQAMRLSGALGCALRDILGDGGADAFAVLEGVRLDDLPAMARCAPCAAIRDPLAYSGARVEAEALDAAKLRQEGEASQEAAPNVRQGGEASLEAARYMEYLASNYGAIIALLDQCLGEGAGLIALRMLSAYSHLNAAGRERCIELMEDLGSIPRFMAHSIPL